MRKKVLAGLLTVAMFFSPVTAFGEIKEVQAADNDAVYVSLEGSDTSGDGSISKPYQSVAYAIEQVRKDASADTICVRGGDYFIEDTIVLDNEDLGLTIKSYEGEEVVFNGAKILENGKWENYEKNTKIKVLQTEKNLGIDQLFLDHEQQTLCRYPNRQEGVLPLESSTNKDTIRQRAASYADPTGGYIRALHVNGWGGNDYIITGKNTSSDIGVNYKWVGDNNRGSDLQDGSIVIENVFEELDAPGEWFYDNESGKLYIYPTEDIIDLEDVQIHAAIQTDIIRIEGKSSSEPVEDITIDGIRFEKTKRTMFTVDEAGKEYTSLLRGDWCVVRAGAVYIENGRGIKVINSEFNDMGGNAIFMYGFNDSNIVDNNEFINMGSTAVQIIGDPSAVYEASFWEHALYPEHQVHKTYVDHPDKIGPANEEYPRDIEVTNNHMENIGIFEKQSCGVNLSISSRVKILHNTIHESARSCINVNDGTFGGHEIAYNDIYNAQIETTDHGPFNSWGRDRFWSVPYYNAGGEQGKLIRNYEKDGKVYDLALLDAYQTIKIHDNRFQHNADDPHTWGIDLDDGSSNYEIYNNLCLGLGIKLREGFERKVYNNIILDGEIQVHVSYEQANDVIERNIVCTSTPYGFASVDENRFKAANYQVDYNWYFDFESKIELPYWFNQNNGANPYDQNALVGVDPMFENPTANNYTVTNTEAMEEIGFENFSMTQFGQPGCECQAPVYAKTSSGAGTSDLLQREEWKGAIVSGVDDQIMSSTASSGYKGIFFESVPEDSEAYQLGYRERDIIKYVNGVELTTKSSFFTEIDKVRSGGLVTLEVHRTNKMQSISYFDRNAETEVIDCNDPAVTYHTELVDDLWAQNQWYFDGRVSEPEVDQGSTICAYNDTSDSIMHSL